MAFHHHIMIGYSNHYSAVASNIFCYIVATPLPTNAFYQKKSSKKCLLVEEQSWLTVNSPILNTF